MNVFFAEDLFFALPPEIGNKVTVVKLNYEESLFWSERVEAFIEDIDEELKPGDIILNRVFDEEEVAHWYLFRILYF